MNPGTFDPTDSSLFILVEGDSVENYVHINAFTTINGYFNYGQENGYGSKLYDMCNFEQYMAHYADTSGIIELYDSTGNVPNSYFQHEADMYNRMVINSNDDRSPIWLFIDYYFGSSTTSLTGFKPFFLAPAYNNSISRYLHLQVTPPFIWGAVSIYDRTFYRSRLGTIGRWSWQHVLLHSSFGLQWFNDKMSSCIAS